MNEKLRLTHVAGEVLERAALLDPRIRVDIHVIEAWADLFDGQKVWRTEALAAVKNHYLKTNPFPIMPGDVVAFCANCPVYSSREHASEFLAHWCEFPYSDMITAQSGIQVPAFAIPDSLPREGHKRFLIDNLTGWVQANHERLVDGIMERRWDPVAE